MLNVQTYIKSSFYTVNYFIPLIINMKKSLLTKVELIFEFLSACFKPTEAQTGKIYNYPHMPYCEAIII